MQVFLENYVFENLSWFKIQFIAKERPFSYARVSLHHDIYTVSLLFKKEDQSPSHVFVKAPCWQHMAKILAPCLESAARTDGSHLILWLRRKQTTRKASLMACDHQLLGKKDKFLKTDAGRWTDFASLGRRFQLPRWW